MELLFYLAVLFIFVKLLKKIIKKVINLILSILFLPIIIAISSVVFKIPFFTGIILALAVGKILKELRLKYNDLIEGMFAPRCNYTHGYLGKLAYMLFDINIFVFLILVGIYSSIQIINPFVKLESIEVLGLIFILTWMIRFIEEYFDDYINEKITREDYI